LHATPLHPRNLEGFRNLPGFLPHPSSFLFLHSLGPRRKTLRLRRKVSGKDDGVERALFLKIKIFLSPKIQFDSVIPRPPAAAVGISRR